MRKVGYFRPVLPDGRGAAVTTVFPCAGRRRFLLSRGLRQVRILDTELCWGTFEESKGGGGLLGGREGALEVRRRRGAGGFTGGISAAGGGGGDFRTVGYAAQVA